MNEVWKDISGFTGKYQVSNLGRIRSLARLSADGRQLRTRIMKQVKKRNGHLKVKLRRDDGTERCSKTCLLVLEAFVRPREPHECSYHEDHDKTNNRVDNLTWVDAMQFLRNTGINFPNFLGAWD